jgi:hypothetical protein
MPLLSKVIGERGTVSCAQTVIDAQKQKHARKRSAQDPNRCSPAVHLRGEVVNVDSAVALRFGGQAQVGGRVMKAGPYSV